MCGKDVACVDGQCLAAEAGLEDEAEAVEHPAEAFEEMADAVEEHVLLDGASDDGARDGHDWGGEQTGFELPTGDWESVGFEATDTTVEPPGSSGCATPRPGSTDHGPLGSSVIVLSGLLTLWWFRWRRRAQRALTGATILVSLGLAGCNDKQETETVEGESEIEILDVVEAAGPVWDAYRHVPYPEAKLPLLECIFVFDCDCYADPRHCPPGYECDCCDTAPEECYCVEEGHQAPCSYIPDP
jgi:hypothetical protein